MSETTQLREANPVPILTAELTPPAQALAVTGNYGLLESRGASTIAVFSDAEQELSALVAGAAVFDQGARVRLRVTGEDRVRWLNGMVTNTVRALATGAHNYTFVLNAQGRIQGDATVFAYADRLEVETDRAQAERLFAHLDRFIIMDDVELAWVEGYTALGLAGPESATLLAALGLPTPETLSFAVEGAITVVGEYSPVIRRFSLWIAEQEVTALWQRMRAAGAAQAGAIAVDALRVLEGTPLCGVDITEKILAQETGQTRALNFTKGCYLGQEIVERVRSQAKVHRGIRQFVLHGHSAAPGMQLSSLDTGAVAGELTSVAGAALAGSTGQVALGTVRLEAAERALAYPSGTAELLAVSPLR